VLANAVLSCDYLALVSPRLAVYGVVHAASATRVTPPLRPIIIIMNYACSTHATSAYVKQRVPPPPERHSEQPPPVLAKSALNMPICLSKNRNLPLDLMFNLQTVEVVLWGKGVR
jgi:hypothetical protein